MRESLIDRVMSAKKDYEVGQVIFYNSGRVDTETNSFAKKMNEIYDSVELEMIMRDLCGATASYSGDFKMDTMVMGLDLGLIYKASDVDENNKPKENAQPVKNIVRYYDNGFNCYMDGEQTNDRQYGKHNVTHQGYVHYDKLVKTFSGSGIEFTGPKSFEEFKKAIQAGQVFDVDLVADMRPYSKGTGLSK